MFKNKQKGFTLIEILIVIGIIALLATIVIIAINPARQFAQARDTQRTSNVNTILNAIGQRNADCKGVFSGACVGVTCPSLPTAGATDETRSIINDNSALTATTIGLKDCLVPTYLTALPFDPNVSSGTDTQYDLRIETTAEGGRISICATNTEPSIPRTSELCVTR